MSTLPELQQKFMKGILYSDPDILKECQSTTELSGEQRMNIYRNNSFLFLTETLKASFPASTALAGAAFFSGLARDFIKERPPQTADMTFYGAHLPEFMATHPSLQSHPYLADVARLEWLRQESYFAADAEPVQVDTLTRINSAVIDQTIFHLHPSLRLMTSPWPVDKLWRLGKGEIQPEAVDIHAGETSMILFRQGNGVEMWTVPPDAMSFVSSLLARSDFETAVRHAHETHSDFSPEQHLGYLFQAGLITGLDSA